MYLAEPEPKRYAIGAQSVCANCRTQIEWRQVLGWLHVDAWFTCSPKPIDGKYLMAQPV